MAFSKYGGALNSGGATGYGVRLLNKLIEDNYEWYWTNSVIIKPDAVERNLQIKLNRIYKQRIWDKKEKNSYI